MAGEEGLAVGKVRTVATDRELDDLCVDLVDDHGLADVVGARPESIPMRIAARAEEPEREASCGDAPANVGADPSPPFMGMTSEVALELVVPSEGGCSQGGRHEQRSVVARCHDTQEVVAKVRPIAAEGSRSEEH